MCIRDRSSADIVVAVHREPVSVVVAAEPEGFLLSLIHISYRGLSSYHILHKGELYKEGQRRFASRNDGGAQAEGGRLRIPELRNDE